MSASALDKADYLLFGELLIAQGLVSDDELALALVEQRKSGRKIGEILEYMGLLSQEALRDAVGQSVGFRSISLFGVIPDSQALSLIQESFARAHKILPVTYDADRHLLKVALSNPDDIIAMDRLRRHIKNREVCLECYVASEKEILASIDHYYGYELSIDGILKEIETGEVSLLSMTAIDEYAHPIVRLVDSLLTDAVKHNASDIHFEPEAFFIRLRYRIDGVLKKVRLLHRIFWTAILVRIKIISEMDISESRLPQDGRISLTIAGRLIDFRVSSQPTTHGENLVLRILDREKGVVPLKQLGLRADVLQEIQYMMAKPIGIFLVTGPTGSGKTTTLYSILNQLNQVGINIMTLEDPVEYPMTMVRQTTVNDEIGLSFSAGIRSLLRQDPDVILVGEIRDKDTAIMATRAAMTGHQVYATLHANSVFGAIPRLLDIGVERSILSGNIIGILAQRLVRKLCMHCKASYLASDFEKKLLTQPMHQSLTLCRGQGCKHCAHTGYKGRIAVLEVLRFDSELDEMILQGVSGKLLVDYAKSKGFQSMAMMGFRLVMDGATSLEELARVVDLTELV